MVITETKVAIREKKNGKKAITPIHFPALI
jgi:hypothetical protein